MQRFIRDPDVSHSEFGQWIHDNLPITFYSIDIDQIVYKKQTRILRVIEEKLPGQRLKSSQNCIFPLFAKGIAHLVKTGTISEGSGVFILWGQAPYETVIVKQICGDFDRVLNHDEFVRFVSGDVLLKNSTLPDF